MPAFHAYIPPYAIFRRDDDDMTDPQWETAAAFLHPLDKHLSETLTALAGTDDTRVKLAIGLLSHRTGEGHVCIDLAAEAESQPWPGVRTPPLAAWRTALQTSGLTAPALPAAVPLVLDAQDRLYLARYWHYERRIADALSARLDTATNVDGAALAGLLDRFFPPSTSAVPDWQRTAAAQAALRRFTVIAGGPGTGKTTTVARLLAILLELDGDGLRVGLAAPTGKAAARLAESLRTAAGRLGESAAAITAMAAEACTIHRLLGWHPPTGGFRHDARNPLALDRLIVDEASMVDLPLMAKLLDALPPTAALILLGDADQLASVEAGSVLGDLCYRGQPIRYSDALTATLSELRCPSPDPDRAEAVTSPLADALVFLSHSHRFAGDRGIGALARAVNDGDGPKALAICADPSAEEATLRPMPITALATALAATVVPAYRAVFQAGTPDDALTALDGFRLLCALREGPFGIEGLNRQAESVLRHAGLIRPGERFYHGRPILITRNDYGLKLYNGDVGVLFNTEEGLYAWFRSSEGTLRRLPPARLPAHETVYAMTVHKAQGSEFDHCVLVLPDQPAPVVTRELVYTGITRARHIVDVWCVPHMLGEHIRRRVQRASGLVSAIEGGGGVADGLAR